MITAAALQRAVEAARSEGAARADAYHRRSRTRFLVQEPGGRLTHGVRVEEGVAVRAWTSTTAEPGFAAGTGESEAEAEQVGRLAGHAAVATGSTVPEPAAGTARAAADESTIEVPVSGAGETAGAPEIFDPEVLRSTGADLRRHLARFEEACGAVRRPGLLWALGVELSLAVVEAQLLTSAGVMRSQRSTLVSVQVRFPNAFGLGRLEIVSRRLSDLEPSLLSRMLASYPVRADRLERMILRPGAGDAALVMAPSAAAALVAEVARRAVARRAPCRWDSAARLDDDPGVDWAPGSWPWDADGRPLRATCLAGPASAVSSGLVPAFALLHGSVRAAPRRAPTNLVLSDVPRGALPDVDTVVQLLEVVACAGDTLLARGVVRADEPRPILATLPGPPEALFRPELLAGSLRAFFAPGAFAGVPELILPGVGVSAA